MNFGEMSSYLSGWPFEAVINIECKKLECIGQKFKGLEIYEGIISNM
jgi:hypothetical protein